MKMGPKNKFLDAGFVLITNVVLVRDEMWKRVLNMQETMLRITTFKNIPNLYQKTTLQTSCLLLIN